MVFKTFPRLMEQEKFREILPDYLSYYLGSDFGVERRRRPSARSSGALWQRSQRMLHSGLAEPACEGVGIARDDHHSQARPPASASRHPLTDTEAVSERVRVQATAVTGASSVSSRSLRPLYIAYAGIGRTPAITGMSGTRSGVRREIVFIAIGSRRH